LVRQPFFADLDREIELDMNEAIEVIRRMSAVSEARPSGRASFLEVIEVLLPSVPTAVQAPEVYAIHKDYFANSPELYRPWMRERLAQAATADTASYVTDRFALER